MAYIDIENKEIVYVTLKTNKQTINCVHTCSTITFYLKWIGIIVLQGISLTMLVAIIWVATDVQMTLRMFIEKKMSLNSIGLIPS